MLACASRTRCAPTTGNFLATFTFDNAPAERSDDGALDNEVCHINTIQSGVAVPTSRDFAAALQITRSLPLPVMTVRQKFRKPAENSLEGRLVCQVDHAKITLLRVGAET